MKRRDFLKILGACVVAPGAVIAAVKAKPKQRWPKYYAKFKPNVAQEKILLEKLRKAFKETKFKRPINTKLIVIYDEFDYTTVNFLKKHRINIKHDQTPHQSPKMQRLL